MALCEIFNIKRIDFNSLSSTPYFKNSLSLRGRQFWVPRSKRLIIYYMEINIQMPHGYTRFLRATAGTAIARLSHRNSVRLSVRPSVCPSVTRVDQAKTVQAIGSSNLHHRLTQRL